MKYSSATITDRGIEHLRDLTVSSGTLRLTYVRTGNGSYTSGETLATKTNLKNRMQQFMIHQVEVDANGQLRITVTATNDGLATGYYMTEMGVFALDENDQEFLLALAVEYDQEQADYMPIWDQSYTASINILSYIKLTNNVSVSVISDTGYAPLTDYLETKHKVNSISISDDGDGNVVLTLPI